MTKRALITGITGQDGAYLARLLLEKGYQVHGTVRRVALEDPSHRMWRINDLLDDVTLHAASLESFPSIFKAVQSAQPDELYHLAAQSFVSYSFEDEFSTLNANINGTHYVLAAVKECQPDCRVYFAGSSEMFGKVEEMPQTERTRFHPRSPYGISKIAGFELTRNYREAYGIYTSSGILYNHESPIRGFEFVTRKITSHVARIKHGLTDRLSLGNLDAKRDWGHARDYVQAMWLILQPGEPDDYVVSSGEAHSVREFAQKAFARVGLDYQDHVVTDERLVRPAQDGVLVGNSRKAEKKLGWRRKVGFDALVAEMVDADMEREEENAYHRSRSADSGRLRTGAVLRSLLSFLHAGFLSAIAEPLTTRVLLLCPDFVA